MCEYEQVFDININRKAKILTVQKLPIGIIVREYRIPGYSLYYWVRLKNGVLIKDLSQNEIQIIKE